MLSKAKSAYAEQSDANSCGDWMAEVLKVFRTNGGGFDLEGFKACLKENDIEPPKVDMKRRSAIGRFRMCAALMLRHRAAKSGFVVIGGKRIETPGAKKRGRKA
jgi:hypothetical protein